MRKQPVRKTENSVKRRGNRSLEKAPPSRSELSISGNEPPWDGIVELKRGTGKGRLEVWGDSKAVIAIVTLLGYVALAMQHFPLEVCLGEGALGVAFVILARKMNAK